MALLIVYWHLNHPFWKIGGIGWIGGSTYQKYLQESKQNKITFTKQKYPGLPEDATVSIANRINIDSLSLKVTYMDRVRLDMTSYFIEGFIKGEELFSDPDFFISFLEQTKN